MTQKSSRRQEWKCSAVSVLYFVATVSSCGEAGTEPSRARIELNKTALTLYHGRADTLSAVPYNARGVMVAVPVAWRSSNEQVVRVDSGGIITASSPGMAVVTAAAGTTIGTVAVTVVADTGKPQIQQVQLSTAAVDLSDGNASVQVRVQARDAASGVKFMQVHITPQQVVRPLPLRQFCSMALESGTVADGWWRCNIPIHRYAAPGPWRVVVSAMDWIPLIANADTMSALFTVINSRPDSTPPVLTDLTYTAERSFEVPGSESRIMTLSARDEESGMLSVEFFLDDGPLTAIYGCGADRSGVPAAPWNPVATVSGRCPVPLVASPGAVWRTIGAVRLIDARGNVREMTTADLAQRGFATVIDVRR